ncbi:sensor histidine kinase [Anaerotignum sp.]|uniref:sensor histidine kinase n=1 Tax=Anaerotignum sp. TaxID=2039241 RepID=UPI0028AC0F7C|nr:GHKL domain-containing protein [Anaerotignum sp.]
MILEYALHIFLSIIQTSIAYLYLNNFFDKKVSTDTAEKISYIVYLISRVVVKLWVGIPFVIVVYNFFGVLMLSFNYKSAFKKRVFIVSFIYVVFTMTNGISALMVPTYNPSLFTPSIQYSFYGSVLSKIMNLSIIFAFILMRKNKDKVDLAMIIKGTFALMPLSSLFVLILIYEASNISVAFKIISIILAMGLNFIMFYIFNNLASYFENEWQTRELKQRTIFYENELLLIQKNLTNMRILKHDLQNHLSVIFGLVKQNKNEECTEYLEEIYSLLSPDRAIAKSGNVVIDSIINFKLYELARNKTKITVNLKIPSEISIPSFDIATIIGNLVDNAIEGTMTINENRFITVSITQSKGMLRLKVQNSFDGVIKRDGKKIFSRKRGFATIGTGMERVLKVIRTYDGLLEYDVHNNIFTVNALIYLPQ